MAAVTPVHLVHHACEQRGHEGLVRLRGGGEVSVDDRGKGTGKASIDEARVVLNSGLLCRGRHDVQQGACIVTYTTSENKNISRYGVCSAVDTYILIKYKLPRVRQTYLARCRQAVDRIAAVADEVVEVVDSHQCIDVSKSGRQ